MSKNISPNVSRDIRTAAALGELPQVDAVGKYGRAPSGVQITATDIWDRADATPTQQLWTAPTQARVHAIVSSSGDDDSAGTGCKTLSVYGLTDWDTDEVSETIIMDGATPVNTVNSYVIIHRMVALTWGSAGPNVGTIKATAATDTTITAVILAGIGQTRMAIYGVPSTKKFVVDDVYGYILSGGGATTAADIKLLVNPIPDSELAGFISKFEYSITKAGNAGWVHRFLPERVFSGPCIVKLQAIGSAADLDVMAGFGGELVDI